MEVFSMLAVVVIMGAVMITLLIRVFNRGVINSTSQLHQMTEDSVQKEEAIKKQYEEAKRQSQEIIAAAQKDAQQQREAVIKQAQDEKNALVAQANAQADEVIRQADKARLALLAEMDERIDERAVIKAAQLLSAAMPEEVKAQIHDRWVEHLIGGSFENLDRLKIPEGLTEIGVVSAFGLSEEQRLALSAKIREKLGLEPAIAEQVDPSVIAGLVVTIGSLCLDGSLRFKIQEVARGKR